jgi:hypothetical protein
MGRVPDRQSTSGIGRKIPVRGLSGGATPCRSKGSGTLQASAFRPVTKRSHVGASKISTGEKGASVVSLTATPCSQDAVSTHDPFPAQRDDARQFPASTQEPV